MEGKVLGITRVIRSRVATNKKRGDAGKQSSHKQKQNQTNKKRGNTKKQSRHKQKLQSGTWLNRG